MLKENMGETDEYLCPFQGSLKKRQTISMASP